MFSRLQKIIGRALVAALMLPTAVWAQSNTTPNSSATWAEVRTAEPFAINTTINGDPQTEISFAWFTREGVTEGRVEIVAKGDATEADFAQSPICVEAEALTTPELNYSVAQNKLAGIEPNLKVRYVSHKATVRGLTPETAYSYRVGSAEGWSPIGRFVTAGRESYNFIYITDTQAENDEMFAVSALTVHAAHRMVPDAAFCLMNGDLVETDDEPNSEWEYQQWFSTMQDVWLSLPLAPTQGNHDKGTSHNMALHFNTDLSFSHSSPVPTDMPGTVYSFVEGPVLFLVINFEDYAREGYLDALARWMRAEVGKHPEARWRVASFHKTIFTGSKKHQSDADSRAVRQAMLPVFDELRIDVALQGHDHIYEVIGPVGLKDKSLIASAVSEVERVSEGGVRENMTGRQGGTFDVSRGTLFFLNNSAGKKKYEPRNEAEMAADTVKHGVENYWQLFSGRFGQTGEPTFSRVSVTPECLTFTTYTVDERGQATLFDSFRVVKNESKAGKTATRPKKR